MPVLRRDFWDPPGEPCEGYLRTAILRHIDAILGQLGAILGQIGAILGHIDAILGHLGFYHESGCYGMIFGPGAQSTD